jgi:hypothetical protein
MFKNIAFAVAAAALIAGSTSAVRADTMIHDSNTGLNQFYHTGTLQELAAQGLPLSDSAKKYMKEHPAGRAAGAPRGNVYLLEDRTGSVFGSAAQQYRGQDTGQDHKQDSHW